MLKIVSRLAVVVLVVAPLSLLAKDLEERKWIQVQTPNFRIRSLLSEKETVELARNLETFRIVVAILTNVDSLTAPVPTEIFAVRGNSARKGLGFSPTAAGYFQSGLRRNLIVVGNGYRMDRAAIMMHEYVHFLIRNHNGFNYPKWYDEGFAEYLSSAQFDSGIVTIGSVPKHRELSFARSDWIDIRQILSPDNYDAWGSERTAMFYAEAWGLVHYLLNRPDSARSFGQELTDFVTLVDSGKNAVDAFEQAFVTTSDETDRNLRRYLRGMRIPGFQLRIDDLVPNFSPQVTKLSRDEIALALGQIALSRNELDRAEHWFSIAAGNDLYRAQAVSGTGDVFKFRGDYETAEPYFEQAVALSPGDPYCQLDFAQYWHERAEETDDEHEQDRYLAKAREYYQNAIKLDNSQPEAFAGYGETFLLEEVGYDTAMQNLEHARRLLPSSITVRVGLAEAYLGANRLDEAEKTARSVLAWSHGGSNNAKRAQEVLDKVAEGRGAHQKDF